MTAQQQFKCLSIRQPQAWAVCVGEKTVENKPKKTNHRGLILIHAGKDPEYLREIKELSGWQEFKDYFSLGAIIGAADLYDCVEFGPSLESNPYAGGPWCYLLNDAKWFREPIPAIGQLGIFNLPENLRDRVAAELKMPGKAIEIHDELLTRIRPSQSEVYFRQGRRYVETEKYPDAIQRLDESINLDTSNEYAYFYRGLAYAFSDKLELAFKDFSAAIKLNDEEPTFFYHRALCFSELDKNEEAVADYSRAIALDESTSDYFCQRGLCLRILRRLPESTKDFTHVIELEPESTKGYLCRSINHHLVKNYESAIADLKRAREIDPEDGEVQLLQCAMLIASGKSEEGLMNLKRIVDEFPDEPEPVYLVYWAHKSLNKPELAEKALVRFKKLGGDEEHQLAYFRELGL